jgi:hypothetical protein
MLELTPWVAIVILAFYSWRISQESAKAIDLLEDKITDLTRRLTAVDGGDPDDDDEP